MENLKGPSEISDEHVIGRLHADCSDDDDDDGDDDGGGVGDDGDEDDDDDDDDGDDDYDGLKKEVEKGVDGSSNFVHSASANIFGWKENFPWE